MSRAAAQRLLLGLAVAAAGYLLAANLFLNTPLGEWAVNRRPARVRLAWDSAWSLWPGHVAMRGLKVSGQQRRVRWWIGVEHGRARLDLPRLLRRELRLAGVRAAGVRSRTVWRPDDGEPPPPRRPPRRRPWRVTLDGVEIAGLRELRAGPLRIEGDGTAAGSLRLVAGRQVEARLDRLALRGGPLRAGRETLAHRADLRAALRLGPYSPRRHPGARGLDFLSGTLRLAAGDPRRLRASIGLRDGVLLAGSGLVYRPPPRAEATRLAFRAAVARGPGGRRLALAGGAAEVAVERPGGAFTADALRLAAATSELRPSRLLAGARRAALWGQLEGERVRLDVTGARTAWSIALPRAATRLDLPALLRRELRLAGLRGEDAEIEAGVGAAPPRPARPASGRRWSIRLADASLAGRARLAAAGLDLTGGVDAAGDLAWSGGTLAVQSTTFSVASGRIARGTEVLARDLALRGTGRLDAFRPGTLRGAAALRPLSVSATIGGRLASLGFLDPYLAKAPWLDLRGDGPLAATLELDRGRLARGSRLRIAPARIAAEYLTSRARGTATVTGAVGGPASAPALDLQVLFGRFDIAARDAPGALPHLRGRGLRLTVTTDDLDLAHAARDVRLRVHLPSAEAPDLAAFNGYLPAGAGLAILGGAGRLSSDFELETAGNRGRGTLGLTSTGMRVRFHDLVLAGALDLRARLAAPDLSNDRFALDGTRLVLERFAWSEADGTTPVPVADGWWAHLDLTRGTVRWTRPLVLESTVAARMKDAGLLLALFARRQRALGWLQGILAEERLAARAELRLAGGAIELDPLRVQGDRLDLRTRLRLSPERQRGYLFVRYGRLATGIELADAQRIYHLRRPLAWYESRPGFE